MIISTFNEPAWLEKVLWGYECQRHKDFQVVIADDGSEKLTQDLINKFISSSSLNIKHVWHPRNGYQKCQILNKAVVAADADYLIFTDGDCIPREDFVECHLANAREGGFLSGGAIRLPMSTSKSITREDIFSQQCFNLDWLLKAGLKQNFLKNLKLTPKKGLADILNYVTPANASWNGGNSSGWKKDILSVNGFDERMEYGGQDRELGERLMNKGLKGKQIRYTAICLHLDHARGYKREDSVRKNKEIRRTTTNTKTVWTPFGIKKEERTQ